MLDACAGLIDEVGYERLTTTLVAERAAVAIGSIYQFFPDKRAIVQALAARNLEEYLTRTSKRLRDNEFVHWWDAVDAAVDEYIVLHRSVPGFRTLHLDDVADVHQSDPERDSSAVIANELARFLTERFGLDATDRLRFSLTISVEMADALIRLAFRRHPDGDEAVLTEAKDLMREYLHSQLDRSPAKRRRPPRILVPAIALRDTGISASLRAMRQLDESGVARN